MGHIEKYLSEIESRGDTLSEADMCARFAQNILHGLLGYDEEDWGLNPHAGEEAGEGIPDLTIDARHAGQEFTWIVSEAKLDDAEIRDEHKRNELWADKRKYVTADTVYFLWLARRTILVCDPVGDILCGVYLDEREAAPADTDIICSTEDEPVREHLSRISAEQAESLSFLDDFREGKLPWSYLPADRETMETLTATLRTIIASLRSYLTRRWNILSARYEEYEAAQRELEERLDRVGDEMPGHRRDLLRERLSYQYRQARELLDFAFAEFCEQQAYTKWEKQGNDQAETEALVEIFCTDAAYVVLGRLLFVRFAEDQQGPEGRPLISPKISNGGLKLWRQLVGAEEPHIGRLVDLAFAQAGSIFEQVFSETPFDVLIDLHDDDFDRVLLLVLYKLNAFDFQKLDRDLLGDLYQKLLPMDMRKKLGEFYTDEEVVEYLLHRTGFVDRARRGAPTILDPACGSGTFLVRATHYLIEGAHERGVSDEGILDLVERCIHGLDINDFAVFIARVNLLFACFDLMMRTRRDIAFQVHEANSLLRPLQLALIDTDDDLAADDTTRTASERVRDGQYDFVVGNPPYVRAERIPDGDREMIQGTYRQISQRNTDLAAYFVYRGIKWLREGGTFGMIVPRGLTDAGYSYNLRQQFERDDVQVTELTPLDWACHDLFDSDTVPVILQYSRCEHDPSATVSVIQRLRSRDDIEQAALHGPGDHMVESTWGRFSPGAEHRPWPLEVTAADFEVYEYLEGLPCIGDRAKTQYGIKLGAECEATDEPGDDQAPLLTGSDIYAYLHTPAERYARISEAEGQSIWNTATWSNEDREFCWPPEVDLPETVAAVAEVGVTVNATAVERKITAAQNTVVLGWWADARQPTEALVGLLNSMLARWYAFVFLRTGVKGGGRRDLGIYPRTLAAIPLTSTDPESWQPGLASLVEAAQASARVACALDVEVWGEKSSEPRQRSTISAWPVQWHDWPDAYGLSKDSLLVERQEPTALQLSKSIRLTSDEAAALDFLELHLPAIVEQAGRISKQQAQALPVPSMQAAPAVLRNYTSALKERDDARDEYMRLVDQVDEAVFDAFEMPDELRQTVRQRMGEFPLNEYAANYRKPWEPTRRPQIRIFEPGERFH